MATNELDPNESMDINMKKWLTEQPLEIKIEPDFNGEGEEEDMDTMQDEMVEDASHEADETPAQNKLFTCKVCNKIFMHASSLHRHQKYHHPLYHEGKPFACKLCPCAFKAKGYLQRHMEKHRNAGASTDIKAEASLICPLCPKVYDTSRNLQLHIATHVGELSPFNLNELPTYATIVKKPVTPVVMLSGSVGTVAQTSAGQEVALMPGHSSGAQTGAGQQVIHVLPMPAQTTIVKEPVTPVVMLPGSVGTGAQASAGQRVTLIPAQATGVSETGAGQQVVLPKPAQATSTIVKEPVTPVVMLPGSVGTGAQTSVGQDMEMMHTRTSGISETGAGQRVAMMHTRTSGVSENGTGQVVVKTELCQSDSPMVDHSGKKAKLCQSPRSKHNGRKSEVCESKRVKIVHKSEHSRVGIDTKVDKEAIDNIPTSKDTAEPSESIVDNMTTSKNTAELPSAMVKSSSVGNEPMSLQCGEISQSEIENTICETSTAMNKPVTENSPPGHGRETKPKCHICRRQFAVEKHLQVHMKTHINKQKIPCPFCDRTFQQTRHLQIHIRAHTGEKPFQCNLCPKSFISKHLLSKHVKYHTQPYSEDVGEIDYRCAVCGKAYSSASGLHRHKQQAHPSGF